MKGDRIRAHHSIEFPLTLPLCSRTYAASRWLISPIYAN